MWKTVEKCCWCSQHRELNPNLLSAIQSLSSNSCSLQSNRHAGPIQKEKSKSRFGLESLCLFCTFHIAPGARESTEIEIALGKGFPLKGLCCLSFAVSGNGNLLPLIKVTSLAVGRCWKSIPIQVWAGSRAKLHKLLDGH